MGERNSIETDRLQDSWPVMDMTPFRQAATTEEQR